MLNDVIAIILFQAINAISKDYYNINDATYATIIGNFFKILFLSSIIGLALGKISLIKVVRFVFLFFGNRIASIFLIEKILQGSQDIYI